MKLSEVSIYRPVFATVLSLVVTLVGLVGYSRLSVREYPNIDAPVVTVTTSYPGASAAIVETQVTKVLEDSLSGIEGIDYLTSMSRQEESQITIRFKLERDPDDAAADVRDRTARVRGHLPDEIDEPVIQKVEADAQPILYIAFSSDRHSALEITDYAERYVKDQLQTLDERRIVRFNGKPAIALGVVKQATANPLEVSNEVAEAMPGILASLPEGMIAKVAHDKSIFIRESVKNVYETIGEAIALVVLIIFLFLRAFRATLVPLVTIPVSLIGAFAIMYMLGFTINTLTLLALVLAIGLVVDDAIVMLENIYRHVEDGEEPVEAALIGSKEIGFAVLAMTLTLAAVYAPIGFMAGTTGKLFTEFAWTLAGAVIVSGFVALTLSPMMCSKLLHRGENHGWLYRVIEAGLRGLTTGYRALLRGALNVRTLVLLIGLAVAGSSYFLFSALKSELAPTEDQGFLVGIIQAPEGATIEYTDTYAKKLEEIFAKVPEAERYFVVSGRPTVSQGTTFLKLKPWGERKRTQQEIATAITPEMVAIPGVVAFPSSPPPLGQGVRDKPIQLVIETARPYDELQVMVDKMLDKAADNPGLVNVDTDLKLNAPQLEVDIDRDKAATVGVEVETLGRTLETLLGGRQVTRFKREGEQYDVIVKVADIDRRNPEDLRRIYVRGRGDTMIPLSNLMSVKESVAPKELNHFNQLRSAMITSHLAPGYTLSEGLELSREGRQGRAAADGPHRLFRAVARVQADEFQHLFHLRACARLHLSGACRAIRELQGSFHHHAHCAALRHRRAARVVVERRHAQHL